MDIFSVKDSEICSKIEAKNQKFRLKVKVWPKNLKISGIRQNPAAYGTLF